MKTALAIGLAIGLGAAVAFAFDHDALNSRKALTTYGKMPMKETVIAKKEAAEEKTIASEEKAAPKKATVAITRDEPVKGDWGNADTSSQRSKVGAGF